MMQTAAPVAGSVAAGPHSANRLTEEERLRVLVEFNRTRTAYPGDLCVHRLFELQAEKTPHQIAVVYRQEALTYDELNRKANRLAHHLRSLGVGAETLVGLSLRRSLDLIVATLAILKAGGAYLPLDPDYPNERLSLMLEDANVALLLSDSALLDRLPAQQARIICLDRESIALEPSQNLAGEATADSLAYVMFTSGSTGRPKGVMIEHRAIARLVKETGYANFSAEQVFLQFAPITFDASTFEIWGALLNGARLAIMPDGVPSLEELGQAIRDYGVTTLWLTAGLFHLMVDERLEDLRPLRQLLAGGDVLSMTHVQKVLDRLDCTLINGYGPTENTTFTCCYAIPREAQPGNSVPIGKPIANTQVYIVDDRLEPLPAGEVGELYIGGDGLARGYLNRPELTAERFVASPFPEVSSARLYKTGDLARFREDGTVEFLGRADSQVKLRGFRIELEEIEVALSRYAGVREALVIAREIAVADKQLVAFIVGEPDNLPEICGLRAYLEESLPDYMIPAFLFRLDALPLNPNGKVDRQALLEMIPRRQQRNSAFIAPESETEKQIAAVLQGVLGIERVSVDDNFFDLGANSLRLARAHNQLQSVFGAQLKIVALFQNPTIKMLARFLNNQSLKEGPVSRVQDRAARQREALARQRQIHKGSR
jgi:amino acid adenylation domain-containing protein